MPVLVYGSVRVVDSTMLSIISNHLKQADRLTSGVIMSAPDLELKDEEIEKRIQMFVYAVRELRKNLEEN
jgi:hypothetical protein